jgi:hypothetical protein
MYRRLAYVTFARGGPGAQVALGPAGNFEREAIEKEMGCKIFLRDQKVNGCLVIDVLGEANSRRLLRPAASSCRSGRPE